MNSWNFFLLMISGFKYWNFLVCLSLTCGTNRCKMTKGQRFDWHLRPWRCRWDCLGRSGGWRGLAKGGMLAGRSGTASSWLVLCWTAAGRFSEGPIGFQLVVSSCVNAANKLILRKIGTYSWLHLQEGKPKTPGCKRGSRWLLSNLENKKNCKLKKLRWDY